MAERFYLDNTTLAAGNTVALGKEESHHLLRVMRLRAGATFRVFGGGREFDAMLCGARESLAMVELVRELCPVSPPRVMMCFAVPWLKGGRSETVVQKLTELGAARILLYASRREVAHGDAKKLERLERVALEACKQCGRADLPLLSDWPDLASAVRSTSLPAANCLLLYEQEKCLSLTRALEAAGVQAGDNAQGAQHHCCSVLVASGPEGGIDERELDSLGQSVTCVGLGARILRAETAPLVAASVILARSGEL